MSSARYDKGLDPFGAATRRRVAQLVAQFTGRDWLAQRVVEATATATATATPPAAAEHGATLVVVYGDSGTGKTSFVCRVLDDDLNAALPPESPWKQLHGRVLACHMCTVNDVDSLDPLMWARAVAGQIFQRLEAGGGAPDVGLGTAAEPGRESEEESFATWLRGQSSWRRILDDWVLPVLRSDGVRGVLGGRDTIWLDSLDEALARERARDTVVSALRAYRGKWPPWVRFVATSRPDEATRRELGRIGEAPIDVDDANNREDIATFVRAQLSGAPPGTADLVCEKAAGVFMYAAEVVRRMREAEGGAHHAAVDVESLPSGLAELYMDRYRHTFRGDPDLADFRAHAGLMLAAIMCARGPLPVGLVEGAGVGGEEGTRSGADPQWNWNQTRRRHLDFVAKMCVGSLARAGLLQLSHKSFADWLRSSGIFADAERRGEILLSEQCFRVVLSLCRGVVEAMREDGASPAATTAGVFIFSSDDDRAYALRHGVRHLLAAGRGDDASRVVLDLEWLLARCRAGDAPGICEDCRAVVQWWSGRGGPSAVSRGVGRAVDLVGRAVGLALPDLRQDWRRLPGQLVGRLMQQARQGQDYEGETKMKGGAGEGAQRVRRLLGQVSEHALEFSWWCPVTPWTLEQAGGAACGSCWGTLVV